MSQPIRSFLRRPLLTAVAVLALALPAGAIPIAISGSFTDPTSNDGGGGALPDTFSITNDLTSGADIVRIVVEVNSSADQNVVFDTAAGGPGGHDFAVVLDQGFIPPASVIDQTTTLTMDFGPGTFMAGETFTFTIDLDDGDGPPDNGRQVEGANIAGATVTAYFNGYMSSPLVATMVDGGGFTATWAASAVVPEPATLSMLSLGLFGLAWNGQRAARRRRQRRSA